MADVEPPQPAADAPGPAAADVPEAARPAPEPPPPPPPPPQASLKAATAASVAASRAASQAASRAAAKAARRADFASWPTHFGNGLTHLGRWLTQLGKWLAHLGRKLARLSTIRPSPLQRIAILGGLAAVSILGALALPGNAFGQACIVAFVPGLCLTLGILGTRWYSGQALDQQLAQTIQHATEATLHLKKSVRYVDDRLATAQGHLDSGDKDGALIEVVRAKTATELSLGAAEQAARQWESLSGMQTSPPDLAGSGHQSRPRTGPPPRDGGGGFIDGGFLDGSVARVEDQYTLIINRGTEHGATADMMFAVMADGGDQILDPETGTVIGELPTEKLRVKVVEVQPKYSRAVTFRTFTPARFGYPALTGYRLTSGSDIPGPADAGAFDAIEESISRMLETELAEPTPVREAIANAKSSKVHDAPVRPQVRVDVGDRVRQVG